VGTKGIYWPWLHNWRVIQRMPWKYPMEDPVFMHNLKRLLDHVLIAYSKSNIIFALEIPSGRFRVYTLLEKAAGPCTCSID
jgi:hypothetical protein